MSGGPIRRLTGAVGLVALAPTAVMLATDAITPTDAALRAVASVVGIVLLGRLVDAWLRSVAGALEREADEGADAGAGENVRQRPTAPGSPGRRRGDHAAAAAR